MNLRLFACLLLCAGQALAAPTQVASFTDPVGDDNGGGNLLYPMNKDFQEGDLDLRTFTLSRDSDGFWFEATFANPVRNPANAYAGAGAESLGDWARKGFYNFNIDVYIDMDRRKDSGNTFTLPGRKLRIDGNYAWERAVILTPRPETIRTELLTALRKQYPDRSDGELEGSVDQSIYFPTKVKVRGKSIAFFVPQDVFAGQDGSDWAMTVLVTGARPFAATGGGLLSSGAKTPLEELELGVLQPVPGRSRASFGYIGNVAPSPVVDALLPSAEQQAVVLSNELPVTGVSWGKRAGNDAAVNTLKKGAQPKKAAAGAESSGPLGFLKSLMGDSSSKAQRRDGPAPPVQSLLDPRAPRYVDTPGAPRQIVPQTVPARLQTLKQLLDDGIITQAEYDKQKQRILGEL